MTYPILCGQRFCLYHFLAQNLNLQLGMDPLILFDKEEVLWETIIKVGDKRTLNFTQFFSITSCHKPILISSSSVLSKQDKNIDLKPLSSGIRNIVIVGVFSPASNKQEVQVAEIIRSTYPSMSMTLSHEVGLIGFLERENASVLNESLKPLCQQTVTAFCTALRTLGLKCPFYLTQNDGTITRLGIIQ